MKSYHTDLINLFHELEYSLPIEDFTSPSFTGSGIDIHTIWEDIISNKVHKTTFSEHCLNSFYTTVEEVEITYETKRNFKTIARRHNENIK